MASRYPPSLKWEVFVLLILLLGLTHFRFFGEYAYAVAWPSNVAPEIAENLNVPVDRVREELKRVMEERRGRGAVIKALPPFLLALIVVVRIVYEWARPEEWREGDGG